MSSNRRLFSDHLAWTSTSPMMLEISAAQGIFMYDPAGKRYIDLISGVSVSYLGHSHPEIIRAVWQQSEKFLHLMVYGEFIQEPQVKYAELLCHHLPERMERVYFVNSGTEAVEGALKLAKRYTGRSEIICFRNAYHGSTMGAMSVMGAEHFKNGYRPLIPDIRIINYDESFRPEIITDRTACLILDPAFSEGGVRLLSSEMLAALRERCTQTGALLVFDEVQTGFGRLGELFAMDHFNVVPDILILAKALGGGMPLGAFISSTEIIDVFTHDPPLGHITTFGGHPVSCAAGMAAFSVLLREQYYKQAKEKGQQFREYLKHPAIKEIRGEGLLIAVDLGDSSLLHRFIRKALENGVVTDWFLFCDTAFRISPALNITPEEIKEASDLILLSLDQAGSEYNI